MTSHLIEKEIQDFVDNGDDAYKIANFIVDNARNSFDMKMLIVKAIISTQDKFVKELKTTKKDSGKGWCWNPDDAINPGDIH